MTHSASHAAQPASPFHQEHRLGRAPNVPSTLNRIILPTTTYLAVQVTIQAFRI